MKTFRLSHSLLLICLAVTSTSLAEDQQKTVRIKQDGSGDYPSIQQAIYKSPAGTIIEIEEGVWKESLKIIKPITLKGSGWNKTRIIPSEEVNYEEQEKLAQALHPILKELDEETQKKVLEAYARVQRNQIPLVIMNCKDVIIQGLSIQDPVTPPENKSIPALVDIEDASISFKNCALLQSANEGLVASGESHLKMENCLVTNCWFTGIRLQISKEGSAEIIDSEIRNNRYSGISIGSPSEDIRIRHCLIHGAGWHGIRYDNCSPTVENNVFHSTAVSGIYASGKTHATVKNNLFYHSGISCWFDNQDTIESNTFIGDEESESKGGISQGLSVLGSSEPVIRKNIFLTCKSAVYQGKINSKSPQSDPSKKLQLEENIFWNNKENISKLNASGSNQEIAPLPEGNTEKQPEFQDEQQKQFELATGSPLLEKGIGARGFPSMKSNWPEQSEESIALKAVNERLAGVSRGKQ